MSRRFRNRRSRAAVGTLAVIAAWSAPSPVLAAGLEPVEITVAGAGRLPATAGVPLPESADVRPDGEFQLRSASGIAIPVQTTPLVIDDAGRVRWLAARFAADLGSGGRKTFTLRVGSSPAVAGGGLRVVETNEAVMVDTGRVVARIGRWDGALVRFGSRETAESIGVLDALSAVVDEVPFAADPNAMRSVSIDESGPLVARVRIAGAIGAPGGSPRLPYRCRLEFRFGWDGVFVLLEWPAPDRRLGPGITSEIVFRSHAADGTRWKVTADDKGENEEETARLDGASDGSERLVVRRRRGPEEATAFEARSDGLVIRCVGADRDFGGGRQATLEAYFGLGPLLSGPSRIPSSPVVGVAGVRSTSGGAPGFPGNPLARLPPAYEALLDRTIAAARAEREQRRQPDDFGDWERRPGVFGNLEFDTIDGLVRLAVRRRDAEILSIALESYRHLRDVDLWRSADAPFTELRPRIHGRDHGGSRFEAGHTFVEGVVALGLASGDSAILETGLQMAKTAALKFVRDDETYRLERGVGWLLHALAAAAEAAPAEAREDFRAAIRTTLDEIGKRRTAVPGLPATSPRPGDEGEEEDGSSANATVVSTWVAAGILAPGLRRASDASGDPRGAAWAGELSAFLVRSFPRDDPRRRLSLFSRIELDAATGGLVSRAGTVWAENLPLVAAGLHAASRGNRDSRAFSKRVFAEGASSLSATRLGGEARSKIWRGLLRFAPD